MALACIAALIVLHQVLLQPSLARLTSDAPVINLSGRQRMLSQRLAKAALALEYASTTEVRRARRDELQHMLAEWQRAHRGLQFGDADLRLPVLTTPAIRQAFLELEPHFAAIVAAAESLLVIDVARTDGAAEAARRASVQAILDHELHFVEQMHGIVGLFEAEARGRVSQLQALGLAIMAAILLLLLIVQMVVVRPAVQLVDREFALSEEQYRRLVESMNDGVIVLDGQGRINFASPRFAEMVGCTASDLMHKPMSILVMDADRIRLDAMLRREASAISPTEIALKHRSGRTIETLVSPRPLNDLEGTSAGLLLVLTDMTARKAAEAHGRQLLEQLAHANRLKSMGEMAAGLAHEINQPLGAIANFAEGCLAQLDSLETASVELYEPLERILQAALRGGEIIRRARAFSQLRPFSLAAVSINDLVREVEELCLPEARRRSVALQLQLAPNLPRVPADAIQIQQVLTNLVQNAFQALDETEAFRRRLTIATALVDDDAVEVVVSDNGVGIATDDAERLFEPFVTTRAEGTGMGLAIARGIVESHGGRIWAERRAEGGATFRFTLPLEPAKCPGHFRVTGTLEAPHAQIAELVHG